MAQWIAFFVHNQGLPQSVFGYLSSELVGATLKTFSCCYRCCYCCCCCCYSCSCCCFCCCCHMHLETLTLGITIGSAPCEFHDAIEAPIAPRSGVVPRASTSPGLSPGQAHRVHRFNKAMLDEKHFKVMDGVAMDVHSAMLWLASRPPRLSAVGLVGLLRK